MSVDASRVPSLRKATASSRDFIVTALTDACMILLVYFVLNGTIAGMFDAWGVSLVDVTTGGYLLLRLWGVHN